MNPLQIRLLLETEFRFYQLQDPPLIRRVLPELGIKPEPRIELLSDKTLRRINSVLRKKLRSI